MNQITKLGTICYVQANNQTLMLHRIKKANDMHEGKWNGLGGKLEPGETPEACVIREVYEESGLRITAPRLRGILTFPAFHSPDVGDIENWYVYIFTADKFEGTLLDDADANEGVLQWIDNDKLLDLNLWPGDKIFIKWLEQERFFSGLFVYDEGKLIRHEVIFY
ncbi:MAG: 8-oxo-dGTP diphosphatase [Chloroflexota bacterium]